MNTALTKVSTNSKTGPIAVSTTSRLSCAPGCPLAGKDGCYAEAGYHTRIHWDAVTRGDRGLPPVEFINKVRQLPRYSKFRHNVAGDLWPGIKPNLIDGARLSLLADATKHLIAWTYTHHEKNLQNLAAIRAAIRRNFTVNLSTESKDEAAIFAKRGYPVTCVVPAGLPKAFKHKEVMFRQCPATFLGSTITCATCGGASSGPLCAQADRNFVVTFPAHGNRAAAAETHCS